MAIADNHSNFIDVGEIGAQLTFFIVLFFMVKGILCIFATVAIIGD